MSALGELGNDANRPTWAQSRRDRRRPEAEGLLWRDQKVEAAATDGQLVGRSQL
jgi:hypothetical protein